MCAACKHLQRDSCRQRALTCFRWQASGYLLRRCVYPQVFTYMWTTMDQRRTSVSRIKRCAPMTVPCEELDYSFTYLVFLCAFLFPVGTVNLEGPILTATGRVAREGGTPASRSVRPGSVCNMHKIHIFVALLRQHWM
ncbi:hypothetical protein Naga_100010g57 [Nannochloropsis gaditana]|uniref:Uncharacterized protein n=1 Tax=Nannochloropsis gaditana TaxID=72520 RepID=W7TJB7_9STRA|nr:hypothetical protein Naga_100010g57 [Nannochloropsis gaditana]